MDAAGGAVPATVSLEALVACVDRELSMRRKVYPRWVNANPPKMTPRKSREELEAMAAVRDALLDMEALRLTVVEYVPEREAAMCLGSNKAALVKRFPVPA